MARQAALRTSVEKANYGSVEQDATLLVGWLCVAASTSENYPIVFSVGWLVVCGGIDQRKLPPLSSPSYYTTPAPILPPSHPPATHCLFLTGVELRSSTVRRSKRSCQVRVEGVEDAGDCRHSCTHHGSSSFHAQRGTILEKHSPPATSLLLCRHTPDATPATSFIDEEWDAMREHSILVRARPQRTPRLPLPRLHFHLQPEPTTSSQRITTPPGAKETARHSDAECRLCTSIPGKQGG